MVGLVACLPVVPYSCLWWPACLWCRSLPVVACLPVVLVVLPWPTVAANLHPLAQQLQQQAYGNWLQLQRPGTRNSSSNGLVA